MKELALNLEIDNINKRYEELLFNLNLIHERLEDLRDNLPKIFLTKKGIKKYIDTSLKERENKIKKFEERIKEVKVKFNNEKDPEKKLKLKKLNEKYLLRINYIRENTLNHDTLDQYFYEDIILLASNGRFDASTSYKKSILINSQLEKYEKYYSKKLKLDGSEEFLKGKVANITESIKNAYVDSHKGLLTLRLLSSEAKALDLSFVQLINQFEYDIGNFRRFYEKTKSFNTF